MFENGKDSVVDEYGRPEPMDYIVDEEQFRHETLSSHTQYLVQLALKSEKEVETMQVEKEAHGTDPDSIFEKRRKTGRPRILHEDHKNAILECIDNNPSAVLDEVMKKLKQIFSELKVSKTTLFDFVKQHCNLSLKKARLQPIDRNSEEKIQECLDWVHKWEKTDMDFTRNCGFLDEAAFHIHLKRSMA
ncbi:hypothetical protein G6F46_006086 [Rhizopus delemar]|uniref:Tc1-like transposase DDE domain-containing protein n=3 Tax=Rhizopus TaxID=4842 RepID=I1CTF1_RHIO9|nr:hypothetical protein RO3G_16442 [Rhizopus delemar RA 99-880]KAG1460512.1 hypothetical protein G6F55_004120 [Rhizopus delemar]KAG1544538.1 hypothetical protein G6F51_006002 [Rhizopus arrhizus]KAG1498472.1 hypothetical protein G6F54_005064 [Rhizopus delemar]KAG1511974.1 hypothetical protein G6F53_005533 [Rhizopus delemar]|eukprot:EIE91731.1 hypothetical protein RO3G_16442 [Rhizopus delemar RA 99-880]